MGRGSIGTNLLIANRGPTMSYRTAVISVLTIFSVLIFTCLLENNYSFENDLIACIHYTSGYKHWWPYIPTDSKETHAQFVVETLLLRCEKKCEPVFAFLIIDDLLSVCRDTCYEIWGFPSSAKEQPDTSAR